MNHRSDQLTKEVTRDSRSGTSKILLGQTARAWPNCVVLLFLLLVLPSVARAQFTYITSNGTITITGYNGPSGPVTIPSTISGLPVTGIDFIDKATSVTIPDTVTNIGNGALSDFSLTAIIVSPLNPSYSSVGGVLFDKHQTTLIQCPAAGKSGNYTVPDTVTNIGFEAFVTCYNVTGVTIPNSVTVIGDYAFEDSGLTHVTVPDSVIQLGNGVFRECDSLTNAVIGNGVTNIPDFGFFTSGLNSVSIGNSVITIGSDAFGYCPLASVTIPDSVTSIGSSAFENCGLTSVTLGSGLKNIGEAAFSSCDLASVTIPNSVSSIGDYAFQECSLTNAVIGSGVINAGMGAFQYCNGLTSVTISNGVSEIGPGMFEYCNLASITIPNSVTRIGAGAFSSCPLTNITIPDSVISIEDSAFYFCSSLVTVTLGNSVASLGPNLFIGCTNLSSITIPDSVTNIANGALSGFGVSLTAIIVSPLNPSYASVDGVLFDRNLTALIQFPEAKAGSYTVPNSVTGIVNYAFDSCTGLTAVTLGDGLTSIGDAAFRQCVNLGSLTIPDSVTNIGQSAFESCSNLTDVTLGNSVRNIGDSAFAFCVSLSNIAIPDSVTWLRDYVFLACTSLTSVTLGTNIPSIPDNAFIGCLGLATITIPNSVTNIANGALREVSLTAIIVSPLNPSYASVDGVLFDRNLTALIQFPEAKAGSYTVPNSVTGIVNYAFDNCTGLTAVTLDDGLTSIGDAAFRQCINLGNLTIPDSVTNIGQSAFESCSNLTDVTLGYGLTSITDETFAGCASLTHIAIPNNITKIGFEAFWGCVSLTSITVGYGVTSIGSWAFAGCSDLSEVYFAGNAPRLDAGVFDGDDFVTVYYLPGTLGWGLMFAGQPTALWSLSSPLILNNQLGVRTNQFSFTISWAFNDTVVVEACTDLANPVWTAVSTNTLVNGSSYFSDPDWANYRSRFYRVRSP